MADVDATAPTQELKKARVDATTTTQPLVGDKPVRVIHISVTAGDTVHYQAVVPLGPLRDVTELLGAVRDNARPRTRLPAEAPRAAVAPRDEDADAAEPPAVGDGDDDTVNDCDSMPPDSDDDDGVDDYWHKQCVDVFYEPEYVKGSVIAAGDKLCWLPPAAATAAHPIAAACAHDHGFWRAAATRAVRVLAFDGGVSFDWEVDCYARGIDASTRLPRGFRTDDEPTRFTGTAYVLVGRNDVVLGLVVPRDGLIARWTTIRHAVDFAQDGSDTIVVLDASDHRPAFLDALPALAPSTATVPVSPEHQRELVRPSPRAGRRGW